MAIHLVGHSRGANVHLRAVPRFTTHSEVRALSQQQRPARACDAVFTCQRGGRSRRCLEPERCPRYRGARVDETSDALYVYCEWSASDPVEARMTLAEALFTVGPRDTVERAIELARHHAVHHLPVLECERLLGVVCLSELLPSGREGETVEERMSADVLAVERDATLGEAAAAMTMFGVGCLPVIEDQRLLGLVTLGDLLRIGVPERVLGVVRCASCQGTHGVRVSPVDPRVAVCAECLQRPVLAYAQLGFEVPGG